MLISTNICRHTTIFIDPLHDLPTMLTFRFNHPSFLLNYRCISTKPDSGLIFWRKEKGVRFRKE